MSTEITDYTSHRGKVRINKHFIQSDFEAVLKVFRDFVPISVDHNDYMDDFVYTGLSTQFNKLEPGERIPTYLPILEKHLGKTEFKGFQMVKDYE